MASKFRIWGSDGDQQDGHGQQNDVDSAAEDANTQNDADNSNSQQDDADTDNDGDNNDNDAEAELDRIRTENIKLKQQIDKHKTTKATETKETNKAQAEMAKIKERNDKLERFMETSYLENAILKDKKYSWHNIEDVRAFIDKSAIRLDLETGKVEGLDLQLKAIAKSKPYLLNTTTTTSTSNSDGAQGSGAGDQQQHGSGSHPFGTGTRTSVQDRQKIIDKYKIGKNLRAL